MALSIKDRVTDRLVRELADMTGESMTEAVRVAVAGRLERLRLTSGETRTLAQQLDALAIECAKLPNFDTRSPDEIIGYDETGMW